MPCYDPMPSVIHEAVAPIRAELDQRTAQLCGVLSMLEETFPIVLGHLDPKTKLWWDYHKEFDRNRPQ